MKKIFKKMGCLLLMGMIVMTNYNVSNAQELDSSEITEDVFAAEVTEIITIDEMDYTYSYYYDSDGNKAIDIFNNNDGVSETLCYDSESGEILLDSEQIATVDNDFSILNNYNIDVLDSIDSYSVNAASQWINRGSQSSKITWKQGATVAVVAGVIAIALGYGDAELVIASMGAGTISIIASLCAGGTVRHTVYEHRSTHKIKIEWTFTANTGESFGPYGAVY